MLRSIRGGAGVPLVVVLSALLLSGCLGNESYKNDPKPPATRTISVFVGEDNIALSPNPFGAGPARFIVTNQTGVLQTVLFSNDEIDREVPVGSGQTVNFKQTVEEGDLSISTSNSAAESLIVPVGPTRPSAQQDLDKP
jgi:hypothetical protein